MSLFQMSLSGCPPRTYAEAASTVLAAMAASQCAYCTLTGHTSDTCMQRQFDLQNFDAAKQWYDEQAQQSQSAQQSSSCTRCNSHTHTADVCYSKICTITDCPRPYGHTSETCFLCERCGKRGHLVKTCHVPVCANAGCPRPIGHVTSACFRLLKCERCDVVGHATATCRRDVDTIVCRYCKKSGHVMSSCRRLAKKQHDMVPPCSECNDNDHGIAACPYLYKNRSGSRGGSRGGSSGGNRRPTAILARDNAQSADA